MAKIFNYSDFFKLYENYPESQNGLLADTNFLISLTYDLAPFYDRSIEFFELLEEKKCRLFCNVNVRYEFLEVHRRIFITEALICMNQHAEIKEVLPFAVRGRIKSLNSRRDKATRNNKQPTILTEGEIKSYAEDLAHIDFNGASLWETLCNDYLKDKLSNIWNILESEFNVSFLSLRDATTRYFIKEPQWVDVTYFMETYGIASADAMIINAFLCTDFLFLVTSDKEIAKTIGKINFNGKSAMVPNGLNL